MGVSGCSWGVFMVPSEWVWVLWVYREVAIDVSGGHGEGVGRALHQETGVGRALVAVRGSDGDA